MVHINYDKLWWSEFFDSTSAKDRVQDINLNWLKLKVNDTCKTDEKLTRIFGPSRDDNVLNKAYLDKNLFKIEGHLSLIEKDYNQFKLQSDKQSVEEVLIERAVKTTIQILYDDGLFDNVDNANEVLKDKIIVERDRPDLDEVNDVIQWFYS